MHFRELRQWLVPPLCGMISGALSVAIIVSLFPQASGSNASYPEKPITPARNAAAHGAAPAGSEEWVQAEEAFQRQRNVLLNSTLTLRLPDPLIPEETAKEASEASFIVPLADHPDWIIARMDQFGVKVTLDENRVKAYLEREVVPSIPAPSHARILSLPSEGTLRADVEGYVRSGWEFDSAQASRLIAETVAAGRLRVTLPMQRAPGRVINETGMDLGEMVLLAQGRSNFSVSPPERVFNIRKAAGEHIDNVLIAPGETFSFNATLGGPVDTETGWRVATGIFNSTDFELTPGGGICQVSTTVYRALVLAGLTITERYNHSQYIKYYREFGEGLDATIFPGSKDLVFTNDTPGFVLMKARVDDEDNVIVDLYGTPDRITALEGPFRSVDAPPDVLDPPKARPLGRRDIAWRQTITHDDGTIEENILISRYADDIPPEPTPYTFDSHREQAAL